MGFSARKEGKPKVLYHGSNVPIEVIEPRPARGVGPASDTLTAVYATDLKNMAIAFAMAGKPDERGHLSWTLEMENGVPNITYFAGTPRTGEKGFIHVLCPDGFEQVADHQWVSYLPVKPVTCETVEIDDYMGWVQFERTPPT